MFPGGGGGTGFALSCYAEVHVCRMEKVGLHLAARGVLKGAMIHFVLVITPADLGEETNDRRKERSSTMSVIGGKCRFKQDTIFFC